MMLGSMMSSGAIESSAWTADWWLLLYQLTYSIIMFLIMLVCSERMHLCSRKSDL
jgi:hypothetical protein